MTRSNFRLRTFRKRWGSFTAYLPASLWFATKLALIFVGGCAAAVAFYCGVVVITGNFHSVEKGRVYRSAQLNREELEKVIAENGIRSILNLRGPNPSSSWYDEELEAANKHNVLHYDFALSSRKRVSPEAMRSLIAWMRAAPKPLLIHCKAGADRTGLVSALYRYAIKGDRAEEAVEELSLRYGHFPFIRSATIAMDDSFANYKQISTKALTIAPVPAR
jgi:protein tyrosine/serine phosphatase